MMEMNSVIVDQECVVVGLSISGKTEEVLRSLKGRKDGRSYDRANYFA